jgi:hypothetical protein
MAPDSKPLTAPAMHSALKKIENRLPDYGVLESMMHRAIFRRRPLTNFIFLIPAAHQIEDARHETRLYHAKKESTHKDRLVAFNLRHTGNQCAPNDHETWKVVGRADPREDYIGRNFIDQVADEEDRDQH